MKAINPRLTRRDFLCLPAGVTAGALLAGWGQAAAVNPIPKFYAYCVQYGVPGVTALPLAAQVKLLKELGYDGTGFELPLDDQLDGNLKLLDDAGLQVFMCWTAVNVDPAKGEGFSPRVPQAIRKLKGRPATISVLLTGLKAGDPAGMEPALRALRTLGDVAAEAGLRISIYNHVDNWTESLPFAAEVAKQANHPQVGCNFNLCHWLKVEGARDWRPWLRANAAKLFCVTINGASSGAQAWTNGLIRPLDEGDFNNRALVGFLAEIGYRGPVGLMCYGVPGEPREHLSRSMRVWRDWQGKP